MGKSTLKVHGHPYLLACAMLFALLMCASVAQASGFYHRLPQGPVINTRDIGNEPEGITIDPVRGLAYVVNEAGEAESGGEPGEAGETGGEAGGEAGETPETGGETPEVEPTTPEAEEDENSQGGIVTVIRMCDSKVLGQIEINSDSEYLTVNPKTGMVFISNRVTREITVIYGIVLCNRYFYNKQTIAIPEVDELEQEPEGVGVDVQENMLYVATKPIVPVATEPVDPGAEPPETDTGGNEDPATEDPTAEEPAEDPTAEEPAEGGEETEAHGHILVFDLSRYFAFVGAIDAGDGPESLVFNPVNHLVYAANEDDGTITIAKAVKRGSCSRYTRSLRYYGGDVIKTISPFNKPTDTIDEVGEADKMAVDTRTGDVYITDDSYRVAKIDPRRFYTCILAMGPAPETITGLAEEAPVSNYANNITVDSERHIVYVASEQDTIAVLDGHRFKKIQEITVDGAEHLDAIGVYPQLSRVFTTDEATGQLFTIRGASSCR